MKLCGTSRARLGGARPPRAGEHERVPEVSGHRCRSRPGFSITSDTLVTQVDALKHAPQPVRGCRCTRLRPDTATPDPVVSSAVRRSVALRRPHHPYWYEKMAEAWHRRAAAHFIVPQFDAVGL